MASFIVRSRTKAGIVETVVDAPTRDEAIFYTVQAVPAGSTIEVLDAKEVPPGFGLTGPTGPTGATGTTGMTGATGVTR